MSTQPASDGQSYMPPGPKLTFRGIRFFYILSGTVLVVLALLFMCRAGILSGWLAALLALAAILFAIWWLRPHNLNIDATAAMVPRWDPSNPDASLIEINHYVVDEAANAINWYWRRKNAQQYPSRFIRFFSWVLAAVAGIMPAFAVVFKKSLDQHYSDIDFANPLWASLLLGLAGALIGLDKAFGFSSGWTRFVLTATTLRKCLEEFRLDWADLRARVGHTLTAETVVPLIDRAKKFRSEIESLVLQETKEWAAEFQSNMAQMEREITAQLDSLKAQVAKTIQAKEAASQPGAIQLTIVNAANAAPGSLKVTLLDSKGQSQQESVTGSSWAKINVAPGQLKLTVEATLGAQLFVDHKVLTVEPGKTATPQVTL